MGKGKPAWQQAFLAHPRVGATGFGAPGNEYDRCVELVFYTGKTGQTYRILIMLITKVFEEGKMNKSLENGLDSSKQASWGGGLQHH